jgi:hypothetical protein
MVILIQEDLDKRFGNEQRKKVQQQEFTQPARRAGCTARPCEAPAEKPPKKLGYVEYKKYRHGQHLWCIFVCCKCAVSPHCMFRTYTVKLTSMADT